MKDLTQRHRGTEKKKLLLALCLCVSVLNPLSSSPTSRPNVLLISIDTLRADRLGCYGYKIKTPAIDALASTSALFENAISQTPLTLPSHSTILTGLYPDRHGVRNNENFVLAEKFTTLAELFRSNGYSTGAAVGSFSLDSSFGIHQGFQLYEDRIGQGHDPELNRHVERRAETVWKTAKKWLDGQSSPWFAFIHFFDPHFPYNPPTGYSQNYDGEIEYTDRIVGGILKYLEDKKWLDTTIVVLLSDHGESLGEHGEENHGIFLYDSTVRVPFLLRAPGFGSQRISQQVRLADVAPTVMELAGLKPSGFDGVSLVPFLKGVPKELPAYSESYYSNLLMGWAPLHSVRWNQKKWIDAPKQEFYDLTKDPKETRNLYTASSLPPGFRAEMKKHARSAAPVVAEKRVDPETQEKLASLGYVTGASTKPISSDYDPKDGIGLWTEIEAAVRDAQSGQWANAEKRFRNVLNQQPDNVIAQKFLANVLRKQNKQEEAILLMQVALKSSLHRNETRTHLAEAYLEKKDYNSALSQLETVLNEEPQNVRALSMAAWLQYQLKKDQSALQSYTMLSKLRSLTEEEAMQAAAISLTNRKNVEAEKFFRLAVDANPKSTAAWKGLGLLLASKQQWNQAVDAFLNAEDCSSIQKLVKQAPIQGAQLEAIQKRCP